MIILGSILLILGFVAKIPILGECRPDVRRGYRVVLSRLSIRRSRSPSSAISALVAFRSAALPAKSRPARIRRHQPSVVPLSMSAANARTSSYSSWPLVTTVRPSGSNGRRWTSGAPERHSHPRPRRVLLKGPGRPPTLPVVGWRSLTDIDDREAAASTDEVVPPATAARCSPQARHRPSRSTSQLLGSKRGQRQDRPLRAHHGDATTQPCVSTNRRDTSELLARRSGRRKESVL
jgi:hypothetical protein